MLPFGMVPADFNPHSPCGERHNRCNSVQPCQISIHTPRVGSDLVAVAVAFYAHISIHTPRVGSDAAAQTRAAEDTISIHTPRVGSDLQVKM